MKKPITVLVTLGDVNGVGPEIALKAAYGKRWPAHVRLVLVGHAGLLARQAEAFGFPPPPPWSPEAVKPPAARVSLWDPGGAARLRWRPGVLSAAAGAAAARWVEAATAACRAGAAHALVTAPICKEAFHKAGLTVPGHTEMLAALTRTRHVAMMLLGKGLQVVIVTRHIALADVPKALTRADITRTIRLTSAALPWLGLRKARVAVCGLNPHAGEGGAMGDEERRLIAPAIRAARRQGCHAVGPLPADAVFHHALHGAYDAVVAMYHDQGLGPLKTWAFDEGVNLTLGLPIVRTSPDHGTAFDIAGRGVARASSMVAAVRWATLLARKRNPWKK